jgi:hypothetical protein
MWLRFYPPEQLLVINYEEVSDAIMVSVCHISISRGDIAKNCTFSTNMNNLHVFGMVLSLLK